jgi:predicted DNA-binding transcriptional regulator AlpA
MDDQFLRQKAVAFYLGVSRHTLRRIMERDPNFPRFIELSPGIRLVRKSEIEAWLRKKGLDARDQAYTAPADTSLSKNAPTDTG